MTATRLPSFRSSSGRKARPSSACTPSAGNRLAEMYEARIFSLPPAWTRLNSVSPVQNAICSNTRCCVCQSSKSGGVTDSCSIPFCGLRSHSITRCSGSGYGSGLSNTPLTTLKIAVFAPMPRASVKIASNVKPGCFRNIRTPNCRSSQSDFNRVSPNSLVFEPGILPGLH